MVLVLAKLYIIMATPSLCILKTFYLKNYQKEKRKKLIIIMFPIAELRQE